ncbi:transcription termination factor NusA [Salinispira pacifica]|uniref:Transcription termination/antitermination protein NusA n=1 Tax=Salinispira pacifica TaxID=1307761 RepID=V5WI18_9SPIO|nr:transcription termination factor NusA [Salinispira pacifica]AHC15189.1 Transcription termination protein NusA [Salinispira pacifica]
MASGLADAIRALVSEKGISEDLVVRTIEEFLLAAYKKTYGTTDNAVVKFDEENGEVAIYAQKEIVEDVYNPVNEIELDEAKKLNTEAEVGDELLIEIDPKEFDRVAVQSAKQKARQTLREIQKDTLYSEFKGKEGEMIIGYYQRERNGTIFVDLGKTEGLLPRRYQSPREAYRPNDRIKAMIYEVNKTASGLQIILTRTHSEFVRKIFELEVPEIYDKTVEIFKIVREPGYRTKIAVYSNRPDVDPVGACVGLKGVRIQAVVRELEGEKIDILKFETDPRDLIKNALSPANVKQVLILDEAKKHALAIVDEDQLSLAIGKQGLNVRLANRLVDWNIDVKTEAQFEEMDVTIASKQAINDLFNDDFEITRIAELPDISDRLVAILNRDNIEYIEDLVNLEADEMTQLDGLTEDDVELLQQIISENLEIIEEESDEEGQEESEPLDEESKEQYYEADEEDAEETDGDEDDYEEDEEEINLISELPGIPGHIVETLKAKGIVEIVDLLNMEDEEIAEIPGLNEDDVLTIQNIIMDTVEIIEEEDE